MAIEQHLFDHFLQISQSSDPIVSNEHLLAELSNVSSAFLNTMAHLGAGEVPIHNDIDAGRLATRRFITLSGLFLLFISGLVFVHQKIKGQELHRQAQIISQVHDSVIFTDMEGYVTGWNKGSERLLGFSEKESLGRHISFVYPEDRHEFLREQIIKPLMVKGDHEVEVHLRKKSGENFFAHLSLSLLKDTNGIPYGMIGYSSDITERKKAEETLRLYEKIISSTDDHMAFISKDYIYQAVNSAYCQAHSKTYEDIIGHSVSELLGKETFEKTVKYKFDRCLNGEEMNYLSWFEFPGSGRKFMDVSYYPYYETDNTISGLVVSSHDITERKKAEEALQDSLQTSADIVASIPSGLFLYQFEPPDSLVLLDGNSEAELLTGIKIDDWRGSEFNEIWPGAMQSGVTEECVNVAKTGKMFQTEDFHYKDERLEGAFRLNVFVIPGNRIGIAFENITERKKAEEQIMASLREKEVLLKEVNHRVKNNMAVISSLLMLQAGKIKDKRYKAIFKESTDRIKTMALIHEKLYESTDLAHIDFSAYLNDLLDAIYKSYGLPHNRIKIKKHIEKIMLSVDAAIPCALIVNELVSNSLKYAFPATPEMPEGRNGEVEVTLRMNDKDEVELRLGDNGVGMDEGKKSESKSIGLTIVNALVRQIRGNLEMGRGKGTEFVITFRRPEK
jgi:PAS domain S-box-containing protein